MDINKINKNLKNFDWEKDLNKKTEQQLYIEKSRESEEYAEILQKTQDYFKQFNINVSDVGFFTAPVNIDDDEDIAGINGNMYQMGWESNWAASASVFVKNFNELDDLIGFIKSSSDIMRAPEYALEDYIKDDPHIYNGVPMFHSLDVKIFEFFDMIGYTKFKNEIIYSDEHFMAKVTDIDSSLFDEYVYIIGRTSLRSHNMITYVTRKQLDDQTELYFEIEDLKLINL